MYSFYNPYIEKENAYYRTLQSGAPSGGDILPENLNYAVDWLCVGAKSILDFGCGGGGFLFCCAHRGVKELVGIDLAEDGIKYAEECASYLFNAQFSFIHGSVEKLQDFPSDCFDSLILSNILDNMRPEDAMAALTECTRVLKPGGKALVKLNSYLTPDIIQQWNIRVLDEELLDDGMLLWNQSDDIWLNRLKRYFSDVHREDVYFEEYDQHNRLFRCVK